MFICTYIYTYIYIYMCTYIYTYICVRIFRITFWSVRTRPEPLQGLQGLSTFCPVPLQSLHGPATCTKKYLRVSMQ